MNFEERRTRLKELMAANRWQCKHVADILGRTDNTVRIWRCRHTARTIPVDQLAILEARSRGATARIEAV